jgi:hypothetical protein
MALRRAGITTRGARLITIYYLVFLIALGFGLRVVELNSLPQSLSANEAIDGVDGLHLFRTHWLVPFLPNDSGRETLFFYVQSAALWFYGISFFSLRFSSVLVSTLTIPLLYLIGRQLKLENPLTRRPLPRSITGLLAATGLAVAYWHLYFSRLALRAIVLPPVLLGLVWCFWRGWRFSTADSGLSLGPVPESRRRLWLAAAGFLLGLALYTYLAARLLLFLFVIFIVIEILRDKLARGEKLVDALIFGSVAVLVSIPLALYFLKNPWAFGNRAQNISILGDGDFLSTLAGNFAQFLLLHFGGGTWLGQWPTLDFLTAAGFLIGLLACLYHIRKPASLFLLLWWGTGFVPALLSRQNLDRVTSILRNIAAWPALFLISAVGLAIVAGLILRSAEKLRGVASQSPSSSLYLRWLVAPLLLLLFGGFTTGYNYFRTWATTYDESSDHPAYIARYLNQASQPTLAPLAFYAEPSTNFLLQARYPTLANLDAGALRALLGQAPAVYLLPDQSTAESDFVLLVPAADGVGTAYLLPPLTSEQRKALAAYTATAPPLAKVVSSQQGTLAQVFPLDAGAPFLPDESLPVQPIYANFGNQAALTGYGVEPAVSKPGQPVALYLRWQMQPWETQPPIDGYDYMFIHLFDLFNKQRYGQEDISLGARVLLNAYRWSPGLNVYDVRYFELPPEAPEGVYRFELGLYRAPAGQRLPVIADNGPAADDNITLGKFHVESKPPAAPQYPLQARFGDSIDLTGVDLGTPRYGRVLTYTLHWQALAPIAQNYTVFAHVLDAAGNLRAQQDTMPHNGQYPTSLWSPGETILDPHILHFPPDIEPGPYTVRVGLYDSQTGQRLVVNNESRDFAELPGPVTVAPDTTRQPPGSVVQNPSPQVSRGDNLGGFVTLLGYDSRLEAGALNLTLYWRCDAWLPDDYITFVQARDTKGLVAGKPGAVIAQMVHAPGDADYPTSLWDVGEVIRDSIRIPIPPGTPPGDYEIAAGLYQPASGARLPVTDAAGKRAPDDAISLTIITVGSK